MITITAQSPQETILETTGAREAIRLYELLREEAHRRSTPEVHYSVEQVGFMSVHTTLPPEAVMSVLTRQHNAPWYW